MILGIFYFTCLYCRHCALIFVKGFISIPVSDVGESFFSSSPKDLKNSMAHSQGWKQYLRKNPALLCIYSARQQLACCVNSLWGPIILSWFWKQYARRGLHSYQNSVLFPFFPFSEIDVSEVGEGTFSSLVSEKGYCRMLRFSWSGQFFACLFLKFSWCIWSKFPETEKVWPSLYTQKCHQEASLSLGSPENLCVSAARTVGDTLFVTSL